MGKKYTCAACGDECEARDEWTDEMAKEEYRALYPEAGDQPTVIVCDDCHIKIEMLRRKSGDGRNNLQ